MLTRVAVVLVVMVAFTALLTVHVTLPALTLIGILAWAVLASLEAVLVHMRLRRHLRPAVTPKETQ